jgi:multidrug efflux pump subunit AcrA (membrane-fusion protein)
VEEQPRKDREWERWPGRKPPDEGLRHRLRGLFAPTGEDEDDLETMIARRGLELEARTEQLAGTISDLERREEQTRRLRNAVEEMLRHGSAELDERHAALSALAAELGARDDRLTAAEHDLQERKRELGAVELRRGAVERAERALAAREASLEQVAAQLAERERRADGAGRLLLVHREKSESEPERTGMSPAPVAAAEHILFVPGTRYSISVASGPAPAPGTEIEHDGIRYRVARAGRSPLPGDARNCAYLEILASPAAAS